MDRKLIFDAVRKLLRRAFTKADVAALDAAIDRATGVPAAPAPSARTIGAAGIALIKKWEGCARRLADGRFAAYPDPGSKDGTPWTIGWGSTGPDIEAGTVWTQAQCDARFDNQIRRYVDEVSTFLGASQTGASQFDALVSFHYNTGKIAQSTLGRLHKAGRFQAAAAEFAKWIYNDGKPMAGLRNRRADEAALYLGDAIPTG